MKITLNDLKKIKAQTYPSINMRMPKSGNIIIIPFDDECKEKGAKDILCALTNLNNELLSNCVIKKGECPQGTFKKPLLIVNDNKKLFVYQAITKENAINVFQTHGINGEVVIALSPVEIELVG